MPKYINPKVEALNKAFDDLIADPLLTHELEDAQRVELGEKLDMLRLRIEQPSLTAFKMATSSPFLGAVYVAIGMGLFDALAMNDGSVKTADELNEHTRGDKNLLVRILRALICRNFVKEVGKEMYKPLPLALVCTSGSVAEAQFLHYEDLAQVTSHLREYFEQHDYKEPVDAWDSPAQLGLNTDKHFFEYLATATEKQHAFNLALAAGKSNPSQEWHELYPVDKKLQVQSDEIVFVDIAGGVGSHISSFKKKHPELRGKMVLQDLEVVVNDIKTPLPSGIDAQVFDLFQPNPVKGAKCYYMCNVLHDWPDMQAVKILQNTSEAMGDDSILLVNESILPETNVSEASTMLDMVMLSFLASKERTEAQWKTLLESAGFKISNIYMNSWNGNYGNAGLIECVKA